MRFSVGAVNVRTGNFVYFDNETHTIRPEHVMASGSLPPGFPAVEIEGEFYWDGGLISNTPLQWVVEQGPRQDTLAFQVDLWSARGEVPGNLADVMMRQKEIQYSSRTRANTDQFKQHQRARKTLASLLSKLPADLLASEEAKMLSSIADEKVYSLVQLIYRSRHYEGHSKDYEFSRLSMEEHWRAGYHDAVRTLRHPEALQRPRNHEGVSHLRSCRGRAGIARKPAPQTAQSTTGDSAMHEDTVRTRAFAMPLTQSSLSDRALSLPQPRISDHHLPDRPAQAARTRPGTASGARASGEVRVHSHAGLDRLRRLHGKRTSDPGFVPRPQGQLQPLHVSQRPPAHCRRTRAVGLSEEACQPRRCAPRSTPWWARSITARSASRPAPWATSTEPPILHP